MRFYLPTNWFFAIPDKSLPVNMYVPAVLPAHAGILIRNNGGRDRLPIPENYFKAGCACITYMGCCNANSGFLHPHEVLVTCCFFYLIHD